MRGDKPDMRNRQGLRPPTSPVHKERTTLRNKKPRLPEGNGAVLMRLIYRVVTPALPLFAATRLL